MPIVSVNNPMQASVAMGMRFRRWQAQTSSFMMISGHEADNEPPLEHGQGGLRQPVVNDRFLEAVEFD
jgi:hypothetical protein